MKQNAELCIKLWSTFLDQGARHCRLCKSTSSASNTKTRFYVCIFVYCCSTFVVVVVVLRYLNELFVDKAAVFPHFH